MINSRRTAVVTGAGSGLGRETALAFASSGTSVIVNDINSDSAEEVVSEIRDGGGQALRHVGDVSAEESVRQLSQLIAEWTGRVDVLVNNAGIADTIRPTIEQRIDDWQRVIDVSLRSTYLCSRQLARDFMLPHEGGSIVNISSIAGLVGLPMRNAYSAAKAGVAMLTRTLGAEWAHAGITVNAVAPGYIWTPKLESLIAEGKLDEPTLIRRIPAGSLGEPEDISAAILFLASDAAKYITGATLPVDGGWCAFGAAGEAFMEQS